MPIESLADLKAWDKNPRGISEKALKGLKYSLEEFGDLSGIVWNERLQSLVCGHQRVKALQEQYNGQCKVENNIILAPNGVQFSIRVVNWDKMKHAAANIAANNQNLAGDFTLDLAPLLDELKISLPDLSLNLNFDDLRLDYPKFFEKEVIEDEVSEVPKEARTKLGDLYELGRHRLLCGDSTKKEDVERLMNDKKANMAIIDPPFQMVITDYMKWLLNWTDGAILIMHSDKNMVALAMEYADSFHYFLVNYYSFGFARSSTAPQMAHHLIGVFGNPRFVNCYDGFKTVINEQMERNRLMPYQKRVALFASLIAHYSQKENIIMDGFVGSGTAIIAAEQTGRICYGMEIEPQYVDVCVSRYCKFVGSNKVKLNDQELDWNG